MFGRNKTSTLMKPKKLHSLDYLKYLYSVLQKNATVTNHNSATIVEALRLMAEILIWGDQNDNSVMDFFLEKNVLEHFVKYLKQDAGHLVSVQLLQTLNILFENISNKSAIYYLLSNRHTNEIITHRFDFCDEEIVAYYISFLKVISLRIDAQTIHFFYNESSREFDLYVECIKLFCHPESMIRIAVRTITLNILQVKDKSALEFIHHQTALPYFSYLVWSIGNTIMDIDDLLDSDLTPQNRVRLDDLVAEHVDHLHYLNDLLSLNIEAINEVLCDQLLHRLLIPLHVYSLTKRYNTSRKNRGVYRPHVTHPVACFMLTHTFVILHHVDIVRVLTEALFLGDPTLTDLARISTSHTLTHAINDTSSSSSEDDNHKDTSKLALAESLIIASKAIRDARVASSGSRLSAYLQHINQSTRSLDFHQPSESLAVALEHSKNVTPALLRSIWPTNMSPLGLADSQCDATTSVAPAIASERRCQSLGDLSCTSSPTPPPLTQSHSSESSIEHTCERTSSTSVTPHPSSSTITTSSNVATTLSTAHVSFHLQGHPFLRSLYRAFEVGPGTDYETLFALLLFSAIRLNRGLDTLTFGTISLSEANPTKQPAYDSLLVDKLIGVVTDACRAGSRVRLITLHLTLRLLADLVCDSRGRCHLTDTHFAQLINAREEATMVLRSYFRNDVIFLDLFENELRELQTPFPPLSKVAMDSNLLVPPVTPKVTWSGRDVDDHTRRTDYRRRWPHSEWEHTQRSIHTYLLIHIFLESLLLARPSEEDGNDDDNKTVGSCDSSQSNSLFSVNLFVNLSVVPGLAGLGDIIDSKTTMTSHKTGDKLDLSSEALIGCTVERDGNHEKRFLVNYTQHLVLVEPDSRQMGWGVITFIGPLQDLEATCDPADSRCLHVSIHTPDGKHSTNNSVVSSRPKSSMSSVRQTTVLLSARFLFEDHIRCMIARQMLLQGRELARQTKLRKIATLLDFSPQFIRETFVFNGTLRSGMNCTPTSDVLHMCDSLQKSATSHQPVRTIVSPNPGTFLLELHNRSRYHRDNEDVGSLSSHRRALTPHSTLAYAHFHQPSHVTPSTWDTRGINRNRIHMLDTPPHLTSFTLVQQQLPTHHKSHTSNNNSTSVNTSTPETDKHTIAPSLSAPSHTGNEHIA